MEITQSRREFLKNVGKVAVAASVVGAVPAMAMAEGETAPEHPFTYVKLDPDETAARGYTSFQNMGGCCIGVADAIIGQLADKVGYPYNQIPMAMFANGATGYGIGSLCGSIGGAAGAIGLLCPAADAKAVLAELMSWYRSAELPIYQPEEDAPAHTVANSVNCVDSVGTFMSAAGITDMADPIRRRRCAGVTADVAKKAVELLNAHFGL